MDKNQAVRLLDDTFNHDFDVNKFAKFIKELFNNFEINPKSWTVWEAFQEYIDSFQLLGSYEHSKRVIDVLVVKLRKTGSVDRARTMQRNFIAKWLGNAEKDAALVAFYGDDPQDWRFSFVKMEYHLVKETDGEVKIAKELTPAKRYSFLVGVNEPNHTCKSQFVNLLEQEEFNPSIEQIEAAFSIDKVTKEFFIKYKELYIKLKEAVEEVIKEDKNIREEFEDKAISIVDFTKKLLGQIVFIYFLQKKGWLGVEKDKSKFKEWGTGPKNFLRKLFEKKDYDNFFNDVLEPLFYEALATERDDDYYSKFECKIPFLNGGLFEPINDYNWRETDLLLRNDIFEQILNTFDRYNFTVKEDEPLEKEVAIDPEMLGKVFENLIEENIRKGQGAYYTPREIVHYMCQQSLINYLETNTGINRGDIERFIQLGDFALDILIKEKEKIRQYGRSYITDEEHMLSKSIRENYAKIDELLKNIKIVDPAVGSGAFPVGMMNEIVKARQILSMFFREDEQKARTNYHLKREIIENCLYGVDIDSSAVDIAKLRFWLSLIVDEMDMKNIQPLPNLDHKIMCGNSLLEEFEGHKLFDDKLLGEVKKDYSFEIKQIDSEIARLNQEKGEIAQGKLKNGKSIKDIDKEINGLIKKKQKILSAPKSDERNATFEEIVDKKIKESQKKLRELKELQHKFFNEQNRKLKKQYRDEIEKIEWEFIEETLKEQGHEEAIKKLEQYKKNKSKPFFLWKLYFAEVFQRENPGFDVVIANPPYGATIDNYTELFERLYPNTTKAFKDIYKIFIDKSLSNLARKKGVVTYIVPNTFLLQPRYRDLREFLLNYEIKTLLNLGEGVFEAVVPTAVLVVKNINPTKNIIAFGDLSIDSKFSGNINFIKMVLIPQEKYLSIKNSLFIQSFRVSNIDEEFLENIVDFKDAGINYQRVNVGLGDKGNSDLSKRLLYEGKREDKEDQMYWKGTDLNDFFVSPKTTRFVRVKTVNNLRKNERVILNKEYFKLKPKLIWRQTAEFPIVALDEKGIWFGRSIQAGIIKKEFSAQFSYNYLLALLNSKYIRYIYIQSVKESGRVFPQVKLEKIATLPIKKVSLEQQKPFIQLVEQIRSITKDDDYLDNPDKQAKVKKLEKEIDQLVYKLYELTPDEIKIVESGKEK